MLFDSLLRLGFGSMVGLFLYVRCLGSFWLLFGWAGCWLFVFLGVRLLHGLLFSLLYLLGILFLPGLEVVVLPFLIVVPLFFLGMPLHGDGIVLRIGLLLG